MCSPHGNEPHLERNADPRCFEKLLQQRRNLGSCFGQAKESVRTVIN